MRRLMLVFVSVGLLGSPASALLCVGDDAAAMACCKNDPQDCNRGGKSDDCCRSLPNDGSGSATLVKSASPDAPNQAVVLIPASVASALGCRLSTGRRLLVTESHVPLDLPPPLLSPLRI